MCKLLLVRHGNTKLNSAERFWGQTDVELSARGIEQAELLRDRLSAQPIDSVYTSNLRRARVTAEIIASRHQVEVTSCTELGEIDFGQAEGLTFQEIGRRYPEVAESMASWSTQSRFPGGEGPEELNGRVRKFLPRLERHGPDETILIVAHAGTLRMLICNLLGLELGYWRRIRLDLASLSILETYPRGEVLSLLNDVSHLES
ncbi:histidine phosphatase family protein [Chloroflexota bacterium]